MEWGGGGGRNADIRLGWVWRKKERKEKEEKTSHVSLYKAESCHVVQCNRNHAKTQPRSVMLNHAA